jgi:hypothetical protein
VVWFVVPESATQLVTGVGGVDVVELRQSTRDCESHSPNHGVEGGDCCGGGSVNEGPTCCTGKPYWGAVKKACDINQYGAPPMDGSKEDDQVGYTGKLYWGVVKKECSIDQYGAPPMDGSKDSQAGVLATVPAAALATAAASQGSACGGGCLRRPRQSLRGQVPAVSAAVPAGAIASKGPTGALVPAATKGEPIKGRGRAAAVAPATVPAGAPAAAAAPTAPSWEAAATA